jgi:hypothetical protein
MAEQVLRVDRQRFQMYCTHVDDYMMQQHSKPITVALGLLEPINNNYIRLLIDYINMLDKDLLLYKSHEIEQLREERLEELKSYCKQYNYDYRVFLDRYLLFKEVENIG